MRRLSLLSAALLLGLAGCSDDDEQHPPDDRQHTTTGKSWTFLIYQVADNNLEEAAVSDLKEMIAAGTNGSFQIVVQSDRAQGYTSLGVGGLGDWTSAKRLKIGNGSLTQVQDLGEVNMGDPKVLSDFIAWGVKAAPADRYALIFWDHGGAWPGFGGDESTSDHDLLTLAELKQGLDAGMKQAGVQQFALIGFDACLMATHETAATMEPFGEYLLASEELEPGHGWDYRSLKLLSSAPTTGPVDVAKAIIAGFSAQAQAEKTDQTITLALIDLYKIKALGGALGSFAKSVKDGVATVGLTVGKQRAAALAFGKDPDPKRDTHMIDLGLFVQKVGQADASLAGVRDGVLKALQQAVVAKVNGSATSAATGLSIYFPTRAAYYDKSYDGVAGVAQWREMIKAYHGAGSQVPQGQIPRFTNSGHLAQVSSTAQTLKLTGTLAAGTGKNVVSTTLYFGVVDATTSDVMVLGDMTADTKGDSSTGSWDMDALVLSQGANQSYAYLGQEVAGNTIKASIPFSYYATTATTDPDLVLLVLVADATNGAILQSTYYLVTQAGLGQLYPAAGAEIVPLAPVIKGSGSAEWMELSQVGFDPGAAISYGFEVLPTSTEAYASLEVADFGGNGDYVYWSGTL